VAHQSFYRRYRPRRFGEVRGQDHVVAALRNAVAGDTTGHAYLFSGPRGTGKTTTARILAKALNCERLGAAGEGEPCCECDSCVAMEGGRSFDLFELDAASNNSVDNVRELTRRAVEGSPGRTKVYILDEVHMLSAAASNALLKTLEEPPGHVVFVLATTDPQKVLPTIRSRTQHYEFRLLSASELEDHVRWVLADSGIDLDDEAIAHVVRAGRGSARDTLSALDQVVAAGGVLAAAAPVEDLMGALADGDTGAAVVAVAAALAQGLEPRTLAESLLAELRNAFLVSLGVEVDHLLDEDREVARARAERLGTARITAAMEAVGTATVDMRNAADPRVPLEVALVRLTAHRSASSDAATGAAPVGGQGGPDLDELAGRLTRLEARLNALGRPDAAPPQRARAEREAPSRPNVTGPEPVAARAADGEPAAVAAPATPAAVEAAPPPAARPTLGAARASRRPQPGDAPPPRPGRSRSTATAPTPPSAAPAATPEAATAATVPAAEPAAAPAVAPVSAPVSVASSTGDLPDRDALALAFGDVVVPSLKGVAKALFAAGRFVSVDGRQALFALENAPTCERAEQYRPTVEAALQAHFGVAVPLRIVDEDAVARGAVGAPPAAPAEGAVAIAPAEPVASAEPVAPVAEVNSAGPAGAADGPPAADEGTGSSAPTATESPVDDEAELLDVDLSELEDATDVATSAVERLTEAFPGSVLMQEDESG
jgi:DNA polymerase III subunit gamma/tau